MELQIKISTLKTALLFTGLVDEEIKRIAQVTSEKVFPAQTVLIEQDSLSDCTYFITSGTVKIYRLTEEGEEVNLALLGPGEVVGEMALIDDQPRSATVEAVQKVEALTLSREEFIKILHQYPEIATNLLSTLAKRVRATNQHLEDSLSKNLRERTWKTLLLLAKYFPRQEITLSQEELAEIVGATRSRVTEVLDELEKLNKITLAHRLIRVN